MWLASLEDGRADHVLVVTTMTNLLLAQHRNEGLTYQRRVISVQPFNERFA